MGFEILFKYYPKNKDAAGYDVESPQSFTKTIGKLEEVPVEKLASSVMAQLARRDIMVFDVEIYEFVKKKITFKETKGGVLIKNKKFLLDGTTELIVEDEAEPEQPKQVEKPPTQVLRWEIFSPEKSIANMLANRYHLTFRRKYAILEEKVVIQKVMDGGMPVELPTYEYVLMNDQSQKIRLSSMHFEPEQKGLVGMPTTQMTEQQWANQPRLTHMDNDYGSSMPVLRR